MRIDVTDGIQLLTQGGAVAALVVVVLGFIRGYVVPGWQYQAALKERDLFRDLLFEALRTTHRAIQVAQKDHP